MSNQRKLTTKELLPKNWKQALLYVTLGYIVVTKIKSVYDNTKIPPGPRGYPFFGSFYSRLFDSKFGYKLAEKYGNIVNYFFFNYPNILVNDVVLLKKIWKKFDKRILNRAKLSKLETLFKYSAFFTDYKGKLTVPLIFVSGNEWKIRRKHSQTSLFRLLTNKKVNEILKHSLSVVDNELDNIIQKNDEWFPRKICMYTAFNTIYVSCFGKSLNINDDEYRTISYLVDYAFRNMAMNTLVNQFPVLLYIGYFRRNTIDKRKLRQDIIEKLVFNRKKIYDKNNPQTYVDYSLNLIDDNKIEMRELLADIFFLFSAGQDTTSSTAEFGIVLLGKYVEIQNEMRQLLIKSHGNDKLLNLNYIRSIPQFRALIYEILRISSVVPFGVDHELRTDEYIRLDNGKEYKLSKDTPIQYNVQYIHHKSKNTTWIKNGMKICLENWLFKDKNNEYQFKMNDSFVSFGIGRRDCVGKMLAIKELYTIIGHLLLNYKWELNDKNIQIKYNAGVTCMVDPPIPVKIQHL